MGSFKKFKKIKQSGIIGLPCFYFDNADGIN